MPPGEGREGGTCSSRADDLFRREGTGADARAGVCWLELGLDRLGGGLLFAVTGCPPMLDGPVAVGCWFEVVFDATPDPFPGREIVFKEIVERQ